MKSIFNNKKFSVLLRLLLIAVILVLTIGVSYSWYSRNGLNNASKEGVGFYVTKSGEAYKEKYTVTTSYLNNQGVWTKLDSVDSDSEYTTDEVSILPGLMNTTKYRTVITNISAETISVNIYLKGLRIPDGAEKYISFGTSSPKAKQFSKSSLTRKSETVNDETVYYYYAKQIAFFENQSIVSTKTFTFDWYLSSTESLSGTTINALTDAGGDIIEYTPDGSDTAYMFYATDYDINSDGSKSIRSAYLINSQGSFIDRYYQVSSSYDENMSYANLTKNSYDGLGFTYKTIGSYSGEILLEGIIVT